MSADPAGGQPTTVGEYEVLGELGRGPGGSVVYRARQPGLARDVALKVVPAAALGPGGADRFLAAARAAARLDHPHVVRVYEYGEEGGLRYVAMALVEGGSLADRLAAGGPLPPARAAGLARKVAVALAHARSRGVGHPALAPAAVLLDRAGEPRVTGFAPVRRAEDSLAAGGPAPDADAGYLAPELLAGRPAGEATDVYGVGAVLYAALTGRPPGGDSPDGGSRATPPVPRALDAVCRKCLAPDPAGRYPTLAALGDDLEARSREFRAGRRARRVAAAVVALLLVGAGVGAWHRFGRDPGGRGSGGDGPGPPPEPRPSPSGLPPLAGLADLKADTPQAERAVAEWVIDAGGTVLVRPGFTNHLVSARPSEHLDGDVRVSGLSLAGRPVGDGDLAPLALLSGLEELYLDGTAVTDAGVVRHLATLPALRRLSLERTAVTDAALPYLVHLADVYLRGTPVTPVGAARLAGPGKGVRVLHGPLPPGLAPGGPPAVPPGKPAALWFDGTARLDLPITYRFGDPITVEATVCPEPKLTAYVSLAATRTPDGGALIGLHYSFRPQAGWLFGIQLQIQGRKWQGTGPSRQPFKPLPVGRPSRLAGVFDGRTLRHFRDGKLEGVVPASAADLDAEAAGMVVGRHPNPGAQEALVGTVRELRVSSVARYAADYTPAARLEADAETLGLYHLDEGAGDVATDASGKDNHGKIQNGRWVPAE